jgi:hypothetical protein
MRLAAVSVLATCLLFAATESPIEAFQKRLESYVKLRKSATGDVQTIGKKATPAEIQAREGGLRAAIQRNRATAKPGDILAPDIIPTVSGIVRGAIDRPGGAKVRASIKEGNPKHEKAPGEVEPVIKVNAEYPKNAPLSTVPPTLLERLPKLPSELEYRFVGRTLILRDREANMIVDYLKEAVPAT